MTSEFSKFVKGFSFLAILVTLVSLSISLWVPTLQITPMFFYIIIFIYLSNLLIFSVLLKGQQERLSHFVNLYMLINFGKLVVYTIIIFVYSYLNRSDAATFILTFFIYYFIFGGYEIYSLLRINKK